MTTSALHIAPPEELEALEDAAAALDGAGPEEILRWVLDRGYVEHHDYRKRRTCRFPARFRLLAAANVSGV